MNELKIPIVASFKKEVQVSELEKVNLFFGYNGSGKTTISRVLKEEKNAIVYNEDFIEDNFRNSDKQKGVFTIGKEAGNAKANIEEATNRKKLHQDKLRELEGTEDNKGLIAKNKEATSKNWSLIENRLWNIKKDTDNVSLFNCLTGYRRDSNKLARSFVNYYSDDRRVTIDNDKLDGVWKNLIKRSDIAFDKNATKKDKLRIKPINKLESIINRGIWKKKIIGSKENSLHQIIDQLKNSDWVNQGRDFLNEQGICPFCQEPLKQNFLEDLKNYFNEEYENDKKTLKNLKEHFNYSYYIEQLRLFLNHEFVKETDLEVKIHELEQLVKENSRLIDSKLAKPSISIELTSLTEKYREMAIIIGSVNKSIISFNKQIDAKGKEQINIKKDFWNYYTSYYIKDIEKYFETKSTLDTELTQLEKEVTDYKNKVKAENLIIAENQRKLTNVQTSINSINASLTRNGFTSFKLKKWGDDSCFLVRIESPDENNIYKSLSEGEKTIISFLYFIEVCKGTTDKTKEILNDRVIVIDDPISSLSHNIVFEVSQIIRSELLLLKKQEKYSQLFILTHNLYLYYEIRGNIDNIERKCNASKPEHEVKLYNTYKVKKESDGGSMVLVSDRKEVLTDYDVYWSIIKECKSENGYKALLPNAMRNILEYYFGFIKDEDNLNNALANITDREFVRFIQRNSHSDKENFTFNIEEINVDNFLKSFEEIFKKTNQFKHYKIKMN